VFFYYLQEEFTTLEEKASNVLQDYEKAQVSCNVKLDAALFFFPFMLESVKFLNCASAWRNIDKVNSLIKLKSLF